MLEGGNQFGTGASEAQLRTLWESAIPLNSAWIEFSDELDDFKVSALNSSARNRKTIADDSRYDSLGDWLPKTYVERQQKLHDLKVLERVGLLNQIYSGELWAIGFQTMDDGFEKITRVPRELFFVDVKNDGPFHDGIYWEKGQLTTEDNSYFDIGVILAPNRQANHELPDSTHTPANEAGGAPTINSVTNPNSRRPGRPSHRDLILKIIGEYAKTDTLFSQPRHSRFEFYRDAILQNGHDPRREPGFSNSTLEKYETEFRRRTSG